MKYSDTVLQLFAKAPVAGEVNTRLIPHIGVQAATDLQAELVHNRLASLIESGLCDVQLWCSPDSDHDFFLECERQYAVSLYAQAGADLGERMSKAIQSGLENYKYVVLIGTDAPALDVTAINEAIEALQQGNQLVLVPAEDGGYVLIGAKHHFPEIFLSVPWGTDTVLRATRRNITALGLNWHELDACWDIDRIEDLHRYRAYIAP